MNAPSPALLAKRTRETFSRPTPTGIACGYCSSGPPLRRNVVHHESIAAVRHCANVADYRAGLRNYVEANEREAS